MTEWVQSSYPRPFLVLYAHTQWPSARSFVPYGYRARNLLLLLLRRQPSVMLLLLMLMLLLMLISHDAIFPADIYKHIWIYMSACCGRTQNITAGYECYHVLSKLCPIPAFLMNSQRTNWIGFSSFFFFSFFFLLLELFAYIYCMVSTMKSTRESSIGRIVVTMIINHVEWAQQ